MGTLTLFFGLTFLVTWAAWLAASALSPGAPTAGAGLPLFYLGVFAPGIVAPLLTRRESGPAGLRALPLFLIAGTTTTGQSFPFYRRMDRPGPAVDRRGVVPGLDAVSFSYRTRALWRSRASGVIISPAPRSSCASGSPVTNDACLEHVLERFLGHSGSAVPADSRLLLARETAHEIAETLQSRSRRVHWRQVYGAEAPLDFPPLPKISAPGAGKFLPAGGIHLRDPSKDRTPKHDVVGFVLEYRAGRTLSTRCVPGTPEYAVLTAELKGNRLNELTVVDADLVSYRFHLPVPDPTLAPGMLVRGRIVRKKSGGSPWYLCLRLWVVESAEVRPRASTRTAPANVSGS